MKNVTVYFLFILLFISCDRPYQDENSYYFHFVNDTKGSICFIFPAKYQHAHFKCVTMKDIEPNDTTIKSVIGYFDEEDLTPRNNSRRNSGFLKIEDMSPYDTVRVFVIDGKIPEGGRSSYYSEHDQYYCRFDFTEENLKQLLDDNGDIMICFPPDIRMKHIKMYPSYDDVCATFSVVGVGQSR